MKIAIDGPSGAGKSTVAKQLAKRLGMVYIDTGAMYRAVALKAYENKTDFTESALRDVLKKTDIDIKYENGSQRIFLDERDVSEDIRRHFMSKMASDVSAFPVVRIFLVELQRQLAAKADSILDGRDIGSFVLPDADYKFYLTASIDERAKRRFLELSAKGEKCDLESIKADIEQRDYQDMNREFAPLKKADNAIVIDSTSMTAEDVVDFIAKQIENKC